MIIFNIFTNVTPQAPTNQNINRIRLILEENLWSTESQPLCPVGYLICKFPLSQGQDLKMEHASCHHITLSLR